MTESNSSSRNQFNKRPKDHRADTRFREEALSPYDPVMDLKRGIRPASSFLNAILKKVDALDGLESVELNEAWDKVAGDFIAKNAKPESLKKGVLVLRVVQPTLKFQLEQMKGMLLNNFKKELGEGMVKSIVLRI